MFGYRSAQRGFSIAHVIVLIVPAVLFWAGGEKLYIYFTNRQLVEASLVEYNAGKTDSKWVKLSGCMVFVPDAVIMRRENSKEIDEVYLPLRPVDDPDAPLSNVVLETRDPALIALAQELAGVGEADILKYVNEHREKFQFEKTCQGLVRVGLESGPSDREKLAKAAKSLTPEFVVIQDGQEPSLVIGTVLLIIGLLFTVFVFMPERFMPVRTVAGSPRAPTLA